MTTAIIILTTPIALAITVLLALMISDKIRNNRDRSKRSKLQRRINSEYYGSQIASQYCRDAQHYISNVNFTQNLARKRKEYYNKPTTTWATTAQQRAMNRLGKTRVGNTLARRDSHLM
jgi:hypothetical protein